MKNLIIPALFALFMASPASALSSVDRVTSESTEERGVTAQIQKRSDGTFAFTVTRYLKPGQKPTDDSDWTIDSATELEIRNKDGLLAQTSVAAKTQTDTIVYWFSLARDCIPYSHFTLTERRRFKDPTRVSRSGGTIYEFDLPEIAERTLKAAAPLHP